MSGSVYVKLARTYRYCELEMSEREREGGKNSHIRAIDVHVIFKLFVLTIYTVIMGLQHVFVLQNTGAQCRVRDILEIARKLKNGLTMASQIGLFYTIRELLQ
jgi:hypothetical protein